VTKEHFFCPSYCWPNIQLFWWKISPFLHWYKLDLRYWECHWKVLQKIQRLLIEKKR